MPRTRRRVIQRFADAPVSNVRLPWGRQGHFRVTDSVQSTERHRPGPPSWRFIVRDDEDAAADNGSDADHVQPAWEPVEKVVHSRRLKTEEVNKRLQEQWDACFDDNVFRHICHQAQREQRNDSLHAKLAEQFSSAAKAAVPVCPSCSHVHSEHGYESLEWATSEQLLYVTIEGRVLVNHPVFRCAACGSQQISHPVSFGCFPATPTEPQVIYDGSLLYLTCKVSLAGSLSMEAWCKVLETMHQHSGCAKEAVPISTGASDGDKVWRNLGMAAQQWQRVADSAESLDRYNITHIAPTAAQGSRRSQQPNRTEDAEMEEAEEIRGTLGFDGPTRQCPCCYSTCQGAMADACLGITHLRSAGSAADSIQPLQQQTPFVDDAVIKELLIERRGVDPSALERPACSDFVATSKGFSERQQRLHIQGVAAATCRHEFTLVAVNLFTHENFVYYELILEQLLRMYDVEKGKKLMCFFLDIMCQFDPYWGRMHPELLPTSPGMAIGPWHVKAHKPTCQDKYGARLLEGAGCSFGDNIEHLWVDLRKQAHLMKRMTKAARQDRLTYLILERQRLKELRLPRMLMVWAQRAVRRAADLQSSISSLESEIAELQGPEPNSLPPRANPAVPGNQHEREPPDLGDAPGAGSSASTADAGHSWQHRYHALLEVYYMLGQTSAEPQPAAGRRTAQSLPQQRRRQELAVVERQLQDIEARMQIGERWPAESRRYWEVGQERKVLGIQRCEAGLHSIFVRHHALQRELRSVPFRERQQGVHIRKRMHALTGKAKALIEELQGWHSAPGAYSGVAYDVAALNASTMLSADVLPWQREDLAASLCMLKRGELIELVARRERCVEEVQIVRREAADMVLFYQHYESEVSQQISILQNAQVNIGAIPRECHAELASAAFCNGATAILMQKLQHITAMKEAASVLVDQLRQHVLEPTALGSRAEYAVEPDFAAMEMDEELEDEFFELDSDSLSEPSEEDEAADGMLLV